MHRALSIVGARSLARSLAAARCLSVPPRGSDRWGSAQPPTSPRPCHAIDHEGLRSLTKETEVISADLTGILQRMNQLIERASDNASQVRPLSKESGASPGDPASSRSDSGDARSSSGKLLGVLDRVYAHSSVEMDAIDVIGFDFDHTLVTYKKELNRRIYQLALDNLLHSRGYPGEMVGTATGFDEHQVIRGLAADRETGALAKLNYSSAVVKARRGHTWLTDVEVEELFGRGGTRWTEEELERLPTTVLTAEQRDSRLIPLNDLYALATGALLTDVIEFFERRGAPYDPRAVVADVTAAIGHVHVSFTIHREVLASLPSTSLVEPAPGLRRVLEQLRHAGKRLFLVTNSPLWYIEPQLVQFVGPDWRELFDVTVASAKKPAWFLPDAEGALGPLREVSPADGSLGLQTVAQLERGKCYAGGSVDEVMRLTGWVGRRVLYLGDSIFADLVDARRGSHNWKTGAVIAELRGEMVAANSAAYREAVFVNHCLDATLRLLQEAMPTTRPPDAPVAACVSRLHAEWRRGLSRQSGMLNQSWGSIFYATDRLGARDPSIFGFALRRHADLYMSELQNIAHYATRRHRFLPPRFMLPHEVTPYVDPVVEQVAGSKRAGAANLSTASVR